MGPFGVIPKLFRMEYHFEWKVITNGLAQLGSEMIQNDIKTYHIWISGRPWTRNDLKWYQNLPFGAYAQPWF